VATEVGHAWTRRDGRVDVMSWRGALSFCLSLLLLGDASGVLDKVNWQTAGARGAGCVFNTSWREATCAWGRGEFGRRGWLSAVKATVKTAACAGLRCCCERR
jgi:hypothetical protein